MKRLYSAESVGMGHPDKVADLISDSIVDFFLSHDPSSHIACETLVTENRVILAGEILSSYTPESNEIESVVRDVVSQIGYNNPSSGFCAETLVIENYLHNQSPDINQGVGDDQAAGDQGNMSAFACDETPECLPLYQVFANELVKRYDNYRKGKENLYPDSKSQVVIEYEGSTPIRIDSIVMAISHHELVSSQTLKELAENLVMSILEDYNIKNLYTPDTKLIVNGTGKFVVHGPCSDTGLTGRKIVIDQSNAAPVGGGAMSGKDPSKVDRSAAYMARHIAKALVKSGVCKKALVSFSYCIGVAQPTHFSVDTLGTSSTKFSDEDITRIIKNYFDLSVGGIINLLKLRRPIYRQAVNYSHYGKEALPWEDTKDLELKFKDLFFDF
jgi:S-adenosylmethionine synthetase